MLLTRDGGAERDKSDRVDTVLEINETAEVTGNVANDGSANSDHKDWDDECRVAGTNRCKWSSALIFYTFPNNEYLWLRSWEITCTLDTGTSFQKHNINIDNMYIMKDFFIFLYR